MVEFQVGYKLHIPDETELECLGWVYSDEHSMWVHWDIPYGIVDAMIKCLGTYQKVTKSFGNGLYEITNSDYIWPLGYMYPEPNTNSTISVDPTSCEYNPDLCIEAMYPLNFFYYCRKCGRNMRPVIIR